MEEIMFIGFKDFYKRRKHIKTIYNKMSPKQRQYYKWYIYSHLFLIPIKPKFDSEKIKDTLWEWLNDDISNNDLKRLYGKVIV